MLNWVAQAGTSFPVMYDTVGVYQRYDQVGASAPFPLDVVIDKRGVIRYVSTRYEPEVMAELVEQLLAE